MKVFKVLRIVFSVLAAASAAVAVMIFILFDLWGFVPVGLCIAFAAAMFLCKAEQEKAERKNNPPPRTGDFITGRVEKEDGEPEQVDGEKE